MGIMLVYDVTDQKSFDSIGKWLRNIDEVGNLKELRKMTKVKIYLRMQMRTW